MRLIIETHNRFMEHKLTHMKPGQKGDYPNLQIS